MRKAKLNKHENSRKRFISIRTRLIASFLVTAIPILLLGVFSYQSAVSSISETAQKTSVETIKQVDKYLEMTLGNIDAVSRHIMSDTDYTNYLFTVNQDNADADRDTYQSSLTASLNNYAYTNDYIQSIILLLKNNKSISTDQAIPANGYERVEKTELIKQVKDKKGSPLWVGNLDELNEILPTSSGKNAVSLMRQARSGNEECGVLIINVKSELVADALADVNLGDGSELHLISSDNRDIAYVVKNDWNHVLDTTQPENQIHGTEFYQTIKNDIAKDGAMTIQYKGREHFALYSKIASTGYTLVVLVPTANFTASAEAIERITTLFTLFAGVIAIAMGLLLAFRMGRTIRRIIDASKKVIDGDLTIQFASKRRDELGILSESLNQMIAHMRELIKDSARTSEKVGEAAKTVAVTSAQVAQASNEVTGTIQEISGGATAQADESERGVTKMQELAMNIQAVSEGAKVIDEYSNQTIALTREGLASVEELEDKSRQTTEFIQAIKADTHVLDDNSQTIRNIVKVIHNIADQTNLLSLNAAIEAARAGEWGKGFAVVAEEIRKLADQSTAATHEITQIINRTLNQTARVVEWAESSENILNSQNEAVRAVSEVFGRITQSMDRLAGQLEKISTGIGQMDHNKDQALAAIHSISSVAEQIAASTQEVAASTEEQMSAIEELANYAKVLEDTAIQLDKSIKRFKV